MVCGTSGSGKSTVTTAIMERLADAAYQVLVVDPEGDYTNLEFAAHVGNPDQAPRPEDVSLPAGYNLYYDDPSRDLRIVALYDRCAHLCCYPGWQVVQNPPPARDYVSDAPTYRVYGLDPIYCVCHGSQYDPMVLVADTNPRNGVRYVGPVRVHGPSSRAIPIIPLRVADDVLLGGMPDPGWYQYC